MNNPKTVLDIYCGSRMFYFNQQDAQVLFCDKRKERHVLYDGRVVDITADVQFDFCTTVR